VLLFASLGALIFFLDHLAHSIQIGAAEPTVSAALLIMLQDAQILITDPDRMQVLAREAQLVLSDAEQLTRQPADLRQVRDRAALLLTEDT
jgi:uncharacterized membrane protein